LRAALAQGAVDGRVKHDHPRALLTVDGSQVWRTFSPTVTDALQMTPAHPRFFDGRNALLAVDLGISQFAKRLSEQPKPYQQAPLTVP